MDGRLSQRSGVIFERSRGAEIAELALDEVQNLFVRDVSSGGDDEMIGSKPVPEALDKMLAIEAADSFWCAENGAPERMFGPKATRENIVKKIFGIVQVHLDFFEDDLAFFSNIIGIELGAKNEIGDNVKSDGEMFVENFGVETDLFFRGERIEHSADGVHFAGDSFGGAAFRAFENHVLDEMGQTIFFGDFTARAVADPHTYRDGTDVSHRLGDDHEAVAEDMLLDVASFGGGSHS
jgi:hypothetical protein